jgi:hypothetical protein
MRTLAGQYRFVLLGINSDPTGWAELASSNFPYRKQKREPASVFSKARMACPAPGIGKQSVVMDAVGAARQDVQQEAAHELVRRQRHGLVTRPSAGTVILAAERDAVRVPDIARQALRICLAMSAENPVWSPPRSPMQACRNQRSAFGATALQRQ